MYSALYTAALVEQGMAGLYSRSFIRGEDGICLCLHVSPYFLPLLIFLPFPPEERLPHPWIKPPQCRFILYPEVTPTWRKEKEKKTKHLKNKGLNV